MNDFVDNFISSNLNQLNFHFNITAGSVDGQHIVAVVTASVDELMTCANIDVANDLKLQSYVTYVGKSSMEVSV